jgi:S-adenosylmethionine:tRNA ribosyltransferase-isomerase
MKLSDFNFEFDESLIAEYPLENRDGSKLLYVPKDSDIKDLNFKNLVDLVRPNDLLIFNNTRVIPAKVKFSIDANNQSGYRDVELNLIRKIEKFEHKGKIYDEIWEALAKPLKHLKKLDEIEIDSQFNFKILDVDDEGVIKISFNLIGQELRAKLDEIGLMPIPPYIENKRKITEQDKSTYQTIFAEKEGAVAAPTAGLHFTKEIVEAIENKGANLAEITLHVGAGTFLPVRVDNVKEHKMHSEYYHISAETVSKINKAKNKAGRIISVGTTSLRALESIANKDGFIEGEFSGDTSIFITPGYKFRIVDCLITNFHLPKSTLFMLVSAFSGIEKMKQAYNHAIKSKYRFFSYGDASFLEKNDVF